MDSSSGMALATAGTPRGLDLNVAAAGNTNVVKAKEKTMKDLGLKDKIEDVLMWQPGKDEASPLDGTPDDPRFKHLKYD